MKRLIFIVALIAAAGASACSCSGGAGSGKASGEAAQTYTNPIIHADYSDPDVCRVGDDFYMTSSSFNCFPGLQILHSTDLVHWEIIGAALRDYPFEGPQVQHGNGVWAPAIRYHNGEFYIYCGDPDRGIFMTKTADPAGQWSPIVWVVRAKGYIDPCPLWDEDGRAYLSHGCAGSRAGIKSVLFVAPMAPDGTSLTGPSRIVYDGHETQPTIEGTKFYKRNGYYYIFSPAGGVPTGWQVVLRSKSPYGPFEEKVVMAQGNSPVNGPHQGAWVDTPSGEDWFIHFQDKNAYGRIVHLQPMAWVEDWPVIGVDSDGDGVGEPVMEYRMPAVAASAAASASAATASASESSKLAAASGDPGSPASLVHHPADSDEFSGSDLGLQWQWPALPSPYWYYADASAGILRLYSVEQDAAFRNLSDAPNLLLQKFPAPNFTVTAKVSFVPNPQLEQRGEACGLIVSGTDYSALKLVDTPSGVVLQRVTCRKALSGTPETVEASAPLPSVPLPVPYSDKYMSTTVPPVAPLPYARTDVYLRVEVRAAPTPGNVDDALCIFSYSLDGQTYLPLGEPFTAAPGKWIGAKMGLFCVRTAPKNDAGWMDADYFRVSY